MDTDIIKIKCPHCGAVLAIKKAAGLESKSVTCPNCKEKSRFVDFKQVVAKPKVSMPDEDATDYRASDDATSYSGYDDAPTNYQEGNNSNDDRIGVLTVLDSGQKLPLKKGINFIGRMASSSTADLQIRTESRRVSRVHSRIEVKQVPGKGLVHYFSNAKNQNPTFIGNNQVEDGDVIILKGGEMIRMADVSLRFTL